MTMVSENLRREPFRILFPLGAVLAWAAVLPWVLFGTGVIRAWLGTYHALTMTQGFLVAMAVGFLGTMLPRRTGAAPLSTVEVCVAVGGLAAIPFLLAFNQLVAAQLAYLVVLVDLVQFGVRRLRRAKRPPLPSFVFLPFGLAGGIVGAVLIAVSTFGHPELLAPGRGLVEEGMLLALVLALAPMLTSIITHDRVPADLPPRSFRRQAALHVAAALLLFGSFAVQFAISERAGLLLRGAVVLAEVLAASRIYLWPTVSGLHRRLYWLAIWFLPAGELAAGARPAYRIPLLHLTFVSGISLLVFAVSFHVVFLHTGREPLARRRPWPVGLVGSLVVVAGLARACAEHFSNHYFEALAIASGLWLAGALFWGAFLMRLILQRPKTS
jgi:uncharacterized protein involved in response to NO